MTSQPLVDRDLPRKATGMSDDDHARVHAVEKHMMCGHFLPCTFNPYPVRASIPCLDHDLSPCTELLLDSDPSAALTRGSPATESNTIGHCCDNSGNHRGHSRMLTANSLPTAEVKPELWIHYLITVC